MVTALQKILDKHSILIHKDHVPSIIKEWIVLKRRSVSVEDAGFDDILWFIDNQLLEELK